MIEINLWKAEISEIEEVFIGKIQDLWDTLEAWGLIDMGYLRPTFTWSNGKQVLDSVGKKMK